MDDFHNHYKTLHKSGRRFMSRLNSKCIKGAPKDIKYVKVIPKVLVPKDSAFRDKNEDLVIKKFFIVKEVTSAVLGSTRALVAQKHHAWFDEKGAELRQLIMIQTMLAGSLRFEGCECADSIMTSGIGGVNTTVRASLKRGTLDKLVKLTDLLKALTQTQVQS